MLLPSSLGAHGFEGHRLLATLLRHEAASALAQARLGQMDTDAAQSIANTCKPELFSMDTLLRDTLHYEAGGCLGVPPLMQALRETVQLFNPLAAQEVFVGGSWKDVRHNALVCHTQDLMHRVSAHLQSLLQLPEQQAQVTLPLQAACARLQDSAKRALRLQVPMQDRLTPDQLPLFMAQLAEQLQLPGEAALPSAAPADDWAALGSDFGILMMATGRAAQRSVSSSSNSPAVDTARRQARRAPLLVAQWMNETCKLDTSDDEACAFWQDRLPLWSTLAGQAAHGLDLLLSLH